MFLRVMLIIRFIIYSLQRSPPKNYVKVIIVVTINPINPVIATMVFKFLPKYMLIININYKLQSIRNCN